jgi:methyl-accepting chemotaxis protein
VGLCAFFRFGFVMARFNWWSLKVKACAAAAALFVAGLGVAGGLSYLAMNGVIERSHEDRTSRAVREALGALQEVRARMAAYSSLLARHPDVAAAVDSNDPAVLEAVFVREFKALNASDPTVASMEATDAKGVILIRGHNPSKKNDDKSNLPQIRAALSGQAAGGLTVSPTSGEAAEDSVRPIKLKDRVIGTLKIGSYFKVATAEELKKKTGLEVVFLAGGKVTETTFVKGLTPSIPPEPIKSAQSGASISFETEINGAPFTGRLVHLPSDAGGGMTIGFFADRSAVEWAKSGFLSSLLLKGAIALVLLLPLVLWLAHRSTRQLLHLVSAMKQVAEGDLAVTIPLVERSDELGQMAKTVEIFKANAAARNRLESEQKEAAVRSARERKSELQQLADHFEGAVARIVEDVSSTAAELEAAASKLKQTAETTQQLSGTVARGSEDASANVQSVASATDALTCSLGEIARQVGESSNIACDAVIQAQQTDARIAALSQAASRIGDVIKLITAVAEQTNLLALNATIEAARAGEAGRGFAIVAQEVKALATQSARATEEIGTQIAGMQSATRESVAAIKEIGATIGRISGIS